MEFEVKVWRSYYDQVNVLGEFLKNSLEDWEGNPPQFIINDDERKHAENEIEQLLKLSDAYLDKCKLYPKEPKWIYNPRDKTTWQSSIYFSYNHMISKRKYRYMKIR